MAVFCRYSTGLAWLDSMKTMGLAEVGEAIFPVWRACVCSNTCQRGCWKSSTVVISHLDAQTNSHAWHLVWTGTWVCDRHLKWWALCNGIAWLLCWGFGVEADSQVSILLPAVSCAADPVSGLTHLVDDSKPFQVIYFTFHLVLHLDWARPVLMYGWRAVGIFGDMVRVTKVADLIKSVRESGCALMAQCNVTRCKSLQLGWPVGVGDVEISGHPIAVAKLAWQACFVEVFDVRAIMCCQSGVDVNCSSRSWCLVSIQQGGKHPLKGSQWHAVLLDSCVDFGFQGVFSRVSCYPDHSGHDFCPHCHIRCHWLY